MKYADIRKIFNKLSSECNANEAMCLEGLVEAKRRLDECGIDYYKRTANAYHYKNTGYEELFGCIEELAEQSGENTDV